MSTEVLYAGQLVVVLVGGVLGGFAPTAALLAVLIAAPIRVEVFADVQIATLLLLGAVAGRAPAIVRVLREEPVLLFATLAFPLWIVASSAWAHQAWFVFPLAAKWLVVTLAAWLAAADRTADPRILVAGAFVAMVPHALWGVGERLQIITPLGEREVLVNRAIIVEGELRGRALFWHPNRLGEFVEQIGLFLAGAGLGGVLPWLCSAGVAIGLLGVWGTGSNGSMATLGGGMLLVAAWMYGARASLRVKRGALWLGGLALLGAAAVGYWALHTHGGLGPRTRVFAFAANLIREHPWLGVGGGNWSLIVGAADLKMSRFWFRGHAHSLPLHVWAELGAIGLALTAALFAAPLWSAGRRFGGVSRAWYGIGVGAAFAVLGLLAHNVVHYFLRDAVDGIVMGLLLGTTVAVARREATSP